MRSYKVVMEDNLPKIVPVYNEVGLYWYQAKAQVRKWFMDKAHELRNVTERTYFEQQREVGQTDAATGEAHQPVEQRPVN